MSVRKLLLFLGVLFVFAGLGLSFVWFNRISTQAPQTVQTKPKGPAVLIAVRPLSSGTLLRDGDFAWKDLPQAEIRPGQLLRGAVTDTEYLGAITRRDFAQGEPLTESELVKPNDRRFLAAVLRPGRRAVAISVDAANSASGLILPGDFVDVILTQNFGDNVAANGHRSVGEAVLRNVRVVAVDQSLGTQIRPAGPPASAATEPRVPKTMTLEVKEREAQKLVVAMQLGKLQLAVRSLAGSEVALGNEARAPPPVWASDVSEAIRQISQNSMRPTPPSSRSPAVGGGNPGGSCASLKKSAGGKIAQAVRCPPLEVPAMEAGES